MTHELPGFVSLPFLSHRMVFLSGPGQSPYAFVSVVVAACGAQSRIFLVLFLSLKLGERHIQEEEQNFSFLLLLSFFSFSFLPLW